MPFLALKFVLNHVLWSNSGAETTKKEHFPHISLGVKEYGRMPNGMRLAEVE